MIESIKSGLFDFNDPKIKTAFALNLCTVSVSQIIDYKDVVILEQEYDAILNNLNLESIPKDEALLVILKQLLDTITFFRMQEGDKEFIDREYQNKMKNAIWSAVPNIGFIFSTGNPVVFATSLASQVGIGYMNYRKTKAENKLEYEKQQWELRRTAIEQFNGLRRELFDTAWRLVDAYKIPDEYRLTERQVTQYNDILMDSDAFRRYERLDSIKDNFIAYPPFWYFFGNAANELAVKTKDELSEYYLESAKTYYEVFIKAFSACNLLRENQVASACALEYIDLLSYENESERAKIGELLDFALKYSGGANDVLQLCAFSYMRIGKADEAAILFRRLVNENYNPIVNAQLLSKYYIGSYLNGDNNGLVGYKYLRERINEKYLFPFPEKLILETGKNEEIVMGIQEKFIENQKEILVKKCEVILNHYKRKYMILFNKCIPVPNDKEYSDDYYDESPDAYAARRSDGKELRKKNNLSDYISALLGVDYPYNYLQVLNDMFSACEILDFTQGHSNELVKLLNDDIIANRSQLLKIRHEIEEDEYTEKTYTMMLDVSFTSFVDRFFDKLQTLAFEYISMRSDIESMNEVETDLRSFCLEERFDTPDVLFDTSDDMISANLKKQYFDFELIDDGITITETDDKYERIAEVLYGFRDKTNSKSKDVVVLMKDQIEFDKYLKGNPSTSIDHKFQRKVVAIIDDRSEDDNDLLFTIDGIVQIIKDKKKESVKYDNIKVLPNNSGLMLRQIYRNNRIDIKELIEIIKKLRKNPVMEVYDNKVANARDMVFGLFKKKNESDIAAYNEEQSKFWE